MLKDIINFPGYEISDNGEIFNKHGKKLKLTLTPKGYLKTNLYTNGKRVTVKIHRIVATTFIKNEFDKPQVNHINGIKTDNRVVNLEWCTNSENAKHSAINYMQGKFSQAEVDIIFNLKSLYSQRYIAKIFGVSKSTINAIITGKSYKYRKEQQRG